MIGNNELRLNEATMMQALQYWLESKMPNGAPTVTGIDKPNQYDAVFIVRLESKESPK